MTVKRIRKILLLIAIAILLLGAVYLALIYNAYMVSVCFAIAGLLLFLLCLLPDKR